MPGNFTSNTPPGTSLKVEPLANTTFYTLSHMRTLLYQFQAPYAPALAGFAVVVPACDYQGLGINYSLDSDEAGQPRARTPQCA